VAEAEQRRTGAAPGFQHPIPRPGRNTGRQQNRLESAPVARGELPVADFSTQQGAFGYLRQTTAALISANLA
jgi:hypothetical protein